MQKNFEFEQSRFDETMKQHGALTPTGKPPPLAVRLEKALPFRRWVAARASCGGAPRPRPRPNPKHNAENDGQEAHQAMRQSEKRGRGATHASQPHEGCPLLHPLQGVSCLSTPLQGGILKPPALRVVDDLRPILYMTAFQPSARQPAVSCVTMASLWLAAPLRVEPHRATLSKELQTSFCFGS